MARVVQKRSDSSPEQGVDTSLLLENLPVPVACLKTDATFSYVNRALEVFLGLGRAEILGQHIEQITGPEHYAILKQNSLRGLSGLPGMFTSVLKRADGTLCDVDISYAPQRNPDETVSGVIFLFQEITPRGLLDETQARLAAIVDSSDDTIVSKTLDGVIISWNRAAETMFGYSAAEAIGQHITLIIPPERRGEEEEVLRRLRRGEKIDHFETVRRAKDGRLVDVSLTVSPIRNARGELVGASKMGRDITKQRQADEALRASEHYRQAVLNSMPESVKVLDRDGNVLHMNPAGLHMLEADSQEQVIGGCIYPLINEEHRAAFQKLTESVFEGAPGGQLEFGACGLKGGQRIFESNIVPLHGATEEVIGALSLTRDITSRKKSERRDAFLVRLDDEIRSLSDPVEITHTAASLLCEHLAADRCSYAEIDLERGVVNVIGNFAPRLPSIVGRYPLESFGKDFFAQMNAGEPHVFRDALRELKGDALAAYGAIGIAAIIAVPILKNGRLVAGMGIHQASPRDWSSEDIELVQVVASRCWESLERGRVERQLRASEEQFRTLADAIPNLAWMAHADGHIFWYNRRWHDYTGRSFEEMAGWGWQSVHDPEILPRVIENWTQSLRTGESFEMVFPLLGADGKFRSFLTRVEPIRDEAGKIRRWFGTNTDITAQEEAEKREKKARQTAELLNKVGPLLAAELNEPRLTQKITDIATEALGAEFGAFFHNVQNESGESYMLYTLAGVDPGRFADFPMPRNTAVFAPTFRGEGVVRSDDITKDFRYGKNAPYRGMPEGHLPVRSYLAVPVRSRSGSVLGGLFFGHEQPGVFGEEAELIAVGIAGQAAIALDNALLFKEIKRSGEALRRANADLTLVNEDLNQFAYSSSHDLREPLRMVSIYSQFLGRSLKDKLSEEESQYLEYVLKGAVRMEALVRDLLSYTQAAEKIEAEAPIVDANVALNQALSSLAAAVDEAEARITRPHLPQVRIAEVHLVQIFQNLLGNALKYRGRDVPDIRIDALRQDDIWIFSVADNGIGIEEQYKEQIFGVFKRLHTDDEYAGTGIGLAICQRIVQRAGGRIWVESEPGRGSTFLFTLPAAD